jgi:hypothetical protein
MGAYVKIIVAVWSLSASGLSFRDVVLHTATTNFRTTVVPSHTRRILIDGLSVVCQEKLTCCINN